MLEKSCIVVSKNTQAHLAVVKLEHAINEWSAPIKSGAAWDLEEPSSIPLVHRLATLEPSTP